LGNQVLFTGSNGVPVIADFKTGAVTPIALPQSDALVSTSTPDGAIRAFGFLSAAGWMGRQGLATKLFATDAQGSRSAVVTAGLSPDGKCLAVYRFAGPGDDGLLLFDLRTGRRRSFRVPGFIRRLTFSPDGRFLTGSGEAVETVVIDTVSGTRLPGIFHQGRIQAAAFSSDGARFAIAGEDRTARVFDWPQRQEINRATLPGPVFAVAFRPAGDSLVTISAESGGNGRIVLTRHPLTLDGIRKEVCEATGGDLSPLERQSLRIPRDLPALCKTQPGGSGGRQRGR
jgi:WD40 repeat protein